MVKPTDSELRWIELFANCLNLVYAKNLKEGAAKLQEALALAKGKFGPTHDHVTACLNLLGVALQAADREQAQRCFKEARQYADFTTEHWIHDVMQVGSLVGLAGAFAAEKNFEDAGLYYQKALSVLEQHPFIAEADNGRLHLALGEACFLKKQYAQAIESYQRAAGVLNAAAKDKQCYLRLVYLNARIAYAYYCEGNYREAQRVLDEILHWRESVELGMFPVMVACINLLGGVWRELGNKGSTEVYLSWGLECCQDVYGMDSATTLHTLNYSANFYMSEKDWSKAAECLREANAYVDRVVECEEAMWILTKLIAISELLGEQDQRADFEESLGLLYHSQYGGRYGHDKALVESGDQGAAAARMQLFTKAMESVQARYDTKLTPQVLEDLGNPDGSVWNSTAVAMGKLYLSRFLEARCAIEPAPSSAGDSTLDSEAADLAQQVATCLAQGKPQEAAALLMRRLSEVEAAQGKYSLELKPILENMISVGEAHGMSVEVRLFKTRVRLLGLQPWGEVN